MPPSAALNPVRPAGDLMAAARALGASGGGAGAARLLALLYDPEVASERVLACLSSEPALAARVLKVANSPYYRLSGSVGTVDRAVQMLGLTAIRGIAAAGCLDRMAPPAAGTAFDPAAFCRHSLAVGCAAQLLARAAGLAIEGEAFMAGLLHDIGMLLLVKADPAAMASFEPAQSTTIASALAAEREHFGATHEECAGLLVQAWQLPEWLKDAVCQHHIVTAAPPGGAGLALLPGLLALADHCAHTAGFVLWPLCGLAPAATLGAALGLDEATLETVITELAEVVARLLPGPEVSS